MLLSIASHPLVGWDLVSFVGRGMSNLFVDGLPFFSHPPYVRTRAGMGSTRQSNVHDVSWKHFPAFECKLPPIALLADKDFRNESQAISTDYDSVADNHLFVMELMRLDHWLWRASETHAITQGKANLLKNNSALVEFTIRSFYNRFRHCYITGDSGRDTAYYLRGKLEQIGLSPAETVFLLVAVLRTLRYAFCIGCGLNSKPALDILLKDLPAHMV